MNRRSLAGTTAHRSFRAQESDDPIVLTRSRADEIFEVSKKFRGVSASTSCAYTTRYQKTAFAQQESLEINRIFDKPKTDS